MAGEETYSPAEASRVLGRSGWKITERRIRQMLQAGELEGDRDAGGRWRIPRRVVQACVRPSHLEAVTHAENMRRGIGTKLDAEKVAEIRRLAEIDYPRRVLAVLFGVSPGHVSSVIRREVWKDVA